MILLFALAGGLPVGMAWSRWNSRPYEPPELRFLWLAFVSFLPQFLVLYLPHLRDQTSDLFSAVCLTGSLLFFLCFAWLNRHVPGMNILLVGLILNLMVIVWNGGFMPIGPQAATRLVGEETMLGFQPGDRFGTKDVLLAPQDTRLEWLADRFLTPALGSYRAAFSLGDVFIAIGAFGMLAWPGVSIKKE